MNSGRFCPPTRQTPTESPVFPIRFNTVPMPKNSTIQQAIVIGASSGIGLETARLLAARGCRVAVTGRRADRLNALQAENPAHYRAVPFDLTAPDALEHLESAARQLGKVDLIVLCSGTGDFNPELDYRIEAQTNRLNIDAFTRTADWSYRTLKQQGGGHFAAVTSVMGLRGSGAAPAYAASKAYQINYLQGLQQRAAHETIPLYITDIRPGSVQTDMMKGEGHFWITSPKDAARYILRAVDRRETVQYVSPRWRLIGQLLQNLPGWLHRKM